MMRIWREAFGGSGAETMGQRRTLGRAFLLLAIGALCLAAIVAISILFFGSFGTTAGKVLLTVVGFAGYSLLALSATTALGREPAWLGPVGIATSAAGFALFVAMTWFTPEGSLLGRLMGSFIVLGVALAHAALLLLLTRRVDDGPVCYVRRATFGASTILTVMILIPLLSSWNPSGTYFRVLGAVAVLAVLGTLLTPIVQKLAAVPGVESNGLDGPTVMSAVGTAELELTYRGRSFAIASRERERPTRSIVISVWEITNGGRKPIVGLSDVETKDRELHAALASAVRQITLSVDEDAPGEQFLVSDQIPA